MNRKANWKEVEEAWIELANCVCRTALETPCLHCDSDAFKVWYQMKFGVAAFSLVDDFGRRGVVYYYYPMYSICSDYEREINLPYVVYYQASKGWGWYRLYESVRTVKELVMHWREYEPPK